MTHGLPKWFRALFTVVMLAFCCLFISQTLAIHSMQPRIDELTAQLEAKQKRLVKQQTEFAEYTAELPLVQAELAETQPLADAASQQFDDLKAQRKALRDANDEQAAVIADLKAQIEALGGVPTEDINDTIDLLDDMVD